MTGLIALAATVAALAVVWYAWRPTETEEHARTLRILTMRLNQLIATFNRLAEDAKQATRRING